jgi:shikimate 5-dehydrogenase|tara:strand:+ start:505 stop:714 length:210 start_codon:yes stop_codon:yes gene_type:complete
MVNQRWLSQKLKKSNQKRKWSKDMENKENKEQNDVTINVTGVSMSGEASINEHNGHIESDKEEPTKEKS